MEERPNYYAIIPADVRYDKDLKAIEKLLYGEITTLTHQTGECWASNNYFAKLYNIYPTTISKYINHLKDKGYIQIRMDYVGNSKEIEKRIICIAQTDNTSCLNEQGGYSQTSKGGIAQTSKENNTSNNNTSINNNNSPETGQRIPYKEIIDHLNMRTNSKYRHTTDGTRTLIKARFNEGYTLEDFIMVIDKMCVYWTGNKKMEMYLRPSTLFNGKNFENYYNMKIPKLTTKVLKDNMDFSDF